MSCLRDGLGDAGHAAGVVGARARLEGLELLDHVTRGAGRRRAGISFWPENPPRWHMVHNTSSAFFLPAANARRVRFEGEGLRLLRGEVLGEIEHVLGGELRHERRPSWVRCAGLPLKSFS